MADIYELHAKAFPHITASVILLKGERVATFATKYVGQSNPNGVTCWGYLWWLAWAWCGVRPDQVAATQ